VPKYLPSQSNSRKVNRYLNEAMAAMAAQDKLEFKRALLKPLEAEARNLDILKEALWRDLNGGQQAEAGRILQHIGRRVDPKNGKTTFSYTPPHASPDQG
jgi:hypothetical protein